MSKGENSSGLLGGLIEFCLRNKLIVLLGVGFFLGWGFLVAPFDSVSYTHLTLPTSDLV